MKIRPANIATAKSLAKRLFRTLAQLKLDPGYSLQQTHEIYAKALGYDSWHELSADLARWPGIPRYLEDLPTDERNVTRHAIVTRLSAQLHQGLSPALVAAIASHAGVGYSPAEIARQNALASPWGEIQQEIEVAPGIRKVSTASHGGYRLSAERRERMLQLIGSNQEWYEEDDEAVLVEAAFPDAFDPDTAAHQLAAVFPDLMEPILGSTAEDFASQWRERKFREFQDQPDSWFVADTLGQLGELPGWPFCYYALRGRDAYAWFSAYSEVAGGRGLYFLSGPQQGYALSMEVGQALPCGFTQAPTGVEKAPSDLSALLGTDTPRHSVAVFIERRQPLRFNPR